MNSSNSKMNREIEIERLYMFIGREDDSSYKKGDLIECFMYYRSLSLFFFINDYGLCRRLNKDEVFLIGEI